MLDNKKLHVQSLKLSAIAIQRGNTAAISGTAATITDSYCVCLFVVVVVVVVVV